MRLFLYYALHTVINTIKKLLKTWVAIMLVCMVFGGVVGLLFGTVIPKIAKTQTVETTSEEMSKEEEEEEAKEEDSKNKTPEFLESRGLTKMDLTEAIVAAVFLLLITLNIATVEKSGQMFKPADVPILFASPLKPQSVMMFRLMCTLGLSLFVGLYMIAQIPNFIHNLGMSPWGAWSILAAYVLTLIFGTLLQVSVYTLTCNSRKGSLKMGNVIIGFYALLAAGFAAYTMITKQDLITAAFKFFTGKNTYWIPFYGWIRGMVMSAAAGETAKSLMYLGIFVLSCVLLVILIWNIKADFYEDAMFEAERVAAKQENAKNASKGLATTREKNRSEKLERDGFNKGWGASVFFYKAVYNRFRFAKFKIFSKTFVVCTLVAIFTSWLSTKMPEMKIGHFWLPAAALAAVMFYRAMGNPLQEDTSREFFILIPEGPFKKIWASLMGSLMINAIDLLLPMLIAGIMLKANPFTVVVWFAFILTVALFSSTVGTFVNLSIPGDSAETIKMTVQMIFIYFGIMPQIGFVVVGALFGYIEIALLAGVVFNAGLGLLFAGLSTKFLGNN